MRLSGFFKLCPLFYTILFWTVVQEGFSQDYKLNTNPKGVNLPVQNTHQVNQDTLGRIWFTTARGIYYSDGIQTYPIPDSVSKYFNSRIYFHVDGDGEVWLYNKKGALKLLKGGYGTWEAVDLGINFDEPQSIETNIFTFGKGKEQEFFIDDRQRIVTWKSDGGKPEVIKERNFEELGVLASVSKIDGENIYFFQKKTVRLQNGIFQEVSFKGIQLPAPPYIVKQSPETKEYFLLGANYLAKGPTFDSPEEIVEADISQSDFMEEKYFGLFFSGENIFYYFNSQLRKISKFNSTPVIFDLYTQLNSFFIHHAFIDREGILWIVTSRGVVNVNNLKFQNYDLTDTDLMSEEISAIHDLGGGDLLFGFNNGIQRLSGSKTYTLYQDNNPIGNPRERVVNFSKDPDTGEIWFSSSFAGVGKYDPMSGAINIYAPPSSHSISSIQIKGDTLLLAGPKSIFIASKSATDYQLYQKSLNQELTKLLGDSIFFLRKASKLNDGRIIVMRAARFENQRVVIENERFVVAEGFDFLEHGEGLLLATEQGLEYYKNGVLSFFRIDGKRLESPVYCLLKDSKGNIWIGTDQGVHFLIGEKAFHYDESNGLVGNEINRGALIESQTGRIMIGTTKGFSVYIPEETFEAKGAPLIHLISYQVGAKFNQDSKKLEVSSTNNSLEVEFLASGFNQQKELWIHYRLNGLENEEWTILKDPKSSKLFFNNLPPGDYQFEIKASYEESDFSDTVSTKPFKISKPIYLQTWFMFLTVSLLISLGVFINILFLQFRKVGLLKVAFANKEKEQFSAEQQFENVWVNSRDSMALTLDNKEIVAVNPSFGELLGKDVSYFPGRSMKDLFSEPDFCEKNMRIFEQKGLPQLEEGFSIEANFPWKSKPLEMELFTKLIQKDYNGQNLILCIFRDISIEKAIKKRLREAKEKAEEANRFKTSLLSNISHEIRTPLNGILGGTEHIMMIRQADQVLISQLDIILQSGERLLSTINSILDMAKIEANKMEIQLEQIEINEFIALVVKPLKNQAERKGIVLKEFYLSNSIYGRIDKRFLEMILNNLLSNAIKYTAEGEIKLQVDKKNTDLFLEIEDTGVGMSEEYLKKLFQPFEQESTGNDRLYDGTGLGLSITKNLIDLLGGEIQVESLKNSGTLVSIQIPI